MRLNPRWLVAILTLPLPVVVLIPAGLLAVFSRTGWAHTIPSWNEPLRWIAAVIGLAGLALAVSSAWAFGRHSGGTPAPWNPPTSFVVRGPYRHVRNPMILGVILVLLAEAMILRSWPLLGWFLIFTVGNLIYIPLVEEKTLARRFGEPYLRYKRSVPRWLPRTSGEGREQ